jgi:hypothetical protein
MNLLLLNAAESGQLAGVRGLLQRGAGPDAFEGGTGHGARLTPPRCSASL